VGPACEHPSRGSGRSERADARRVGSGGPRAGPCLACRCPVDAWNAVFVRSPMVAAVGETDRCRRFIALVALGLAAAIMATGCTASAAAPPTPTAPSTAPDADSEAILVAAVDAYTRYSAAFDVVSALGGKDPSPLKEHTTSAFFTRLSAEGTLSENGWVTVGSTSFDSEKLVDYTDTNVTIQVCRDVSRVKVLDSSGTDVTPDDRAERFLVSVTLTRSVADAELLVDSSVRDGEDDSCVR
jgi:hypothetical protein